MNEQKIEDFYGVYLLSSQSVNQRYRNRCYIGYTVNPNRRINQHNRGMDYGGARKTNNKGPWIMVMIIHGFPNNISALQFEWAWQSPKQSSRLKMIKDLEKKKSNESHFDYNFRILSEMLRIGPWNRLPLIIRWITSDYIINFPPDKMPPLHMQICHGRAAIIKKKSKQNDEIEENYSKLSKECHLCMKIIENPERTKINCINPVCKLNCHIICLANHFIEPGHYIPIDGNCPICETYILWGDLIRKKNGCNDLVEDQNNEDYLSDLDYDNDDDDNDNDNNDANMIHYQDEKNILENYNDNNCDINTNHNYNESIVTDTNVCTISDDDYDKMVDI